ncbi:MAG: hypothetical protein GC178_10185 [Flavobacteriales bacterium]|nr:hypothetical protein [Flavobacteriales bacterium]
MKPSIKTLAVLIATLFSVSSYAQQGMGVGTNTPLEMLHVTGAIKVGTDINNSSAAPSGGAGTIRFKAGQFEGWDGTSWIPLGGGADADWTISGNDMSNTNTGNIGIGTTTPDRQLNIESATGPQMLFTRNDNNTTDGEVMGELLFDNNDDTAPSSVDAAAVIRATASGPQGNSNKGGNILFLTKNNAAGGANATEMMRIAANGNIGVGTSTPVQKLDVAGSIRMVDGNQAIGYIPVSDANGKMTWTDPTGLVTGDAWGLTGNAGTTPGTNFIGTTDNQAISFKTNDLERVRVAANGALGIGTTTPNTGSYGTTNRIDIRDENGNLSDISQTVAGNGYPGYYFVKQKGTLAGPLAVGSSDILANIEAALYRGNGFAPAARIRFKADGAVSGTSSPGSIGFFTTPVNAIQPSERLTIKNSGNVGIGTTNPVQKLSVWNGDAIIGGNQNFVSRGMTIYGARQGTSNTTWNAYTQGHAFINFDNYDADNSSTQYTSAIITSSNTPGSDDGDLRFFTTSNMIVAEAMRIDHLGNVGIGTAPSQKLHVAGSIQMVDGNQQAGYIPVSDANGKMVWTDPSTIATEPQTLSVSGNQVTLSNGGGTVTVDDGDWTINGTDQYSAVSGNVGVGTTGPSAKLEVSGSDVTANGTGSAIRIRNTAAGGDAWVFRVGATGNNTPAGGFSLANPSGYHMVFDASGNVCLGSNTPEAHLHVSNSTTGSSDGIKLTQGAANSLIYHNSDNDLIIRKAAQTDQLVLDNDGNIGIGLITPGSTLHVLDQLTGVDNFIATVENKANAGGYANGLLVKAGQNTQSVNNRFISFRRPDGTEIGAVRQTSSSGVDYNTTSDERLKTNITPTAKGLQDLMQIEVKDYVYKEDPKKPQTGFIAQQVYQHYPNAVSVGGNDAKTDPWMMDYGKLTPLLVKAVQDQQALIEQLISENQDQQKRIEELEAQR